jgi:hypothetical protein
MKKYDDFRDLEAWQRCRAIRIRVLNGYIKYLKNRNGGWVL